MGGPRIDPYSALNIANGAFRNILFEAEKTKTAVKLGALYGPEAAPQGPQGPEGPKPGADDALKLSKIEVKGESMPVETILDNENLKRCDNLAKALGFKDLPDYMNQIVTALRQDGFDMKQSVPVLHIAAALLSTDAVRALETPQSTQVSAVDEFVVVEGRGKDEAVQTGSTHIFKSVTDGKKLVDVAVGLAQLVSSGRLEEKQIYAYANMRTCDVRESTDMVGAARTCIGNLRAKLEQSDILKYTRDQIKALRTPAEGEEKVSEARLHQATKLEVALESYLKKLDTIFPRDIVATKHTRGPVWKTGKSFQSEASYLAGQANLLTDWLKATYSKPPEVTTFVEAEVELKRSLIGILGKDAQEAKELPVLDQVDGKHGKIAAFIEKDLRTQVQILRNEVKYAETLAGDAEVRHAQEMALTQFAKNKDGRILPSRYEISLGAAGGFLFGVSANAAIRVGGGFNYKMTINVDHAGKVTVLSVKGPRGDISFGAKTGSTGFNLRLSGGRMKGKELVYENVEDFLKNSSTDLRLRLHAGGLLHFGADMNIMARKVDNMAFDAMLHDAGYLRAGDSFMTRPVSTKVMDENIVVTKNIGLGGRITAGSALAKGHAELQLASTHRTHVTYRSRFANVKSLEEIPNAENLVRLNKTKGNSLKDQLTALQDELKDFEQAVRYQNWQNSSKLRKWLNRHTAHLEPPKMSLQEHLLKRVPGFTPSTKVSDDIKAQYLASIAATGAALGVLAHDEKADFADEAEKTSFAEDLQKLQDRAHQPECPVSSSARKKHLYTSTETNLGSMVSVNANVTANVNMHQPIVKVGGVDFFGAFAPGVKLGCNYLHRPQVDKTGIPHLDADRLEIVVGTNGIKAEQVISGVVKALLNKLGGGSVAKAAVMSAVKPFISPSVSALKNVVTGEANKAVYESERFQDTNIDLGFAQANVSLGGDVGTGLRLQLVRGDDGKWKLETAQAINYSETSFNADISGLFVPGFGMYGSISGGYGSTTVLGERSYGTSLSPMMRAASEFNLANLDEAKMVSWNAYLANNDKGLVELAQNLAKPDSEAAREFGRYADLARGLEDGASLADKLREEAKALSEAATPEARKQAATALFTTLSQVTNAHLKAHPPATGEKAVKMSADEQRETRRINQLLSEELDVSAEDMGLEPESDQASGFAPDRDSFVIV